MKKIGLVILGALTLGQAMAADDSTDGSFSGLSPKDRFDGFIGVVDGGAIVVGTPSSSSLTALNDSFSVVPNVANSVSGNVVANDSNVSGSFNVSLNGAQVSEFGFLQFSSNGDFTYTLYDKAESVTGLKVGDVVTDTFSYSLKDGSGQTVSATLTINIIGNPVDPDGNTVLPLPEAAVYDFADVDIEFNNTAAQATALTSARMIKGHMHDGNDRDWYILPSAGNEIISLEVCPQESSCFNKKRWVLYVFDADWFTPAMEGTFLLDRWVDETGTTKDLLGNQIISGVSSAGGSDHLYLAYRKGLFDGALIGIVDPCFDTSNTVDIGVGPEPKNYLIAVSNPLHGDEDEDETPPNENTSSGECGQGNVVLEKEGLNAAGLIDEIVDGATVTKSKSYTTTEQFVSVYHSDDQYTIRVTGTGLHPLLSEQAQAKSATFNAETGELLIPKVRVGGQYLEVAGYGVDSGAGGALEFQLADLVELDIDELADAYQAVYNPDNQQVLIPRVTDTSTGNGYSVILQYHPATDARDAWLEVLSVELIQ